MEIFEVLVWWDLVLLGIFIGAGLWLGWKIVKYVAVAALALFAVVLYWFCWPVRRIHKLIKNRGKSDER